MLVNNNAAKNGEKETVWSCSYGQRMEHGATPKDALERCTVEFSWTDVQAAFNAQAASGDPEVVIYVNGRKDSHIYFERK